MHEQENERVAREHTTKLATVVATVKVELSATVANSKVQVDGDVIPPADYGHAEVDPGHHVLEAGAPGMKNVRQEFDVEGQGGNTLTIQLVAGDNTIVIDRGRSRRRTAVVIAVGGAALYVATGVLAWHERSRWSAVADAARAHEPAAVATANDAQHVARIYVTGLFAAGTVAVAGAVFVYLTAPHPEVIDRTVLVPTVSPEGAGLAITGRF